MNTLNHNGITLSKFRSGFRLSWVGADGKELNLYFFDEVLALSAFYDLCYDDFVFGFKQKVKKRG